MSINQPFFNALILGYTGAVGSALLEELVKSDKVNGIVCLGRRPAAYDHHKIQFVQADLSKLVNHLDAFSGISRVYCCLGTTMKQAGSKEAFKNVDYNMVVDAANIAKQAGVTHFSLVSAVGADAKSKIFYNRVKGETEKALEAVSFDRLSIYRPGLLLGERKEIRVGERIGAAILPFIQWLFPTRFRSIQVRTVAKAMLLNSIKTDEGLEIIFNDEMKILAKGL
ncbi:MAG: NAD(P)H-binding protein [Sphingobacteriaceae bacterium]|nr:NAD(P)H-binding protein [Sphingobacteriaceae bacterium]